MCPMRSLLLIALLWAAPAMATKIADNTTLAMGNISEFYGDIQEDESGKTNGFTFHPIFSLRFDYFLKDFIFSPEVGTLFPKKGRDPHISTLTYYTFINGSYQLKYVRPQIGGGLVFTRISADGGTESLNNGGEMTDFPLPQGPSTAMNLVTNLGLEFIVHPEWSLQTSAWIYNITDKLSRSYSYLLFVHYHFGEFKTDI